MWSVVKPQLALVSTFAVIFLMGYIAVQLFTPSVTVNSEKNISAESEYFEGNFMETSFIETSFIDFYDSAKDSLLKEEQVDPNEIVEYLNTNASSVYIASLE